MREIIIGGKKVRIRATPLALLFHKQEFNEDIVGNVIALQAIRDDPSKLDSVALLQMIWAMAKADSYPGKEFPSFLSWVAGLETFDLTDEDLLLAVLEEAAEGFLSKQTAKLKAATPKKSKKATGKT